MKRVFMMCMMVHLFLMVCGVGLEAASNGGLQWLGKWTSYCTGAVVQDQKAYLFEVNRMTILDVSNPATLQLLGELTLPMNIVDLAVSGKYAYAVTSLGENQGAGSNDLDGLRVIDVSDYSKPRQVAFYPKLVPTSLYITGNYLYLASAYEGVQFVEGGFDILDIATPASPRLLGQFKTDGILDIQVVGNMVYAVYFASTAYSRSAGMMEVEVANWASPRLLNRVRTYFSDGFHNQGNDVPMQLVRSGNVLFMSTFSMLFDSKYQLYIYDIRVAGSAQQLSIYSSDYWFASMFKSGVYLYLPTGDTTGIQVLDVTDPTMPVQRDLTATEYIAGIVFVEGDTVYLAEGEGGLTIWSAAGINRAPFGLFETPVAGTTTAGSFAVSGWVLDDKGIADIKIYRHPVAGEGDMPVYIGTAQMVAGSRPDVEVLYPTYPMGSGSGWGYMLLSNYNMPDQGNGPVTLTAVVTDTNGVQVALGSKTITLDNAHSVKPFGAIDTPDQGGVAAGKSYLNWGWVLTPLPNTIATNGSGIQVYVDGVGVGHPVYNLFRSDVASYYPGYNNSNGAVGYFTLDTTKYSNGVHTIAWSATDNGGNTEGIGSRYFTITNPGHRENPAYSQVRRITTGGYGGPEVSAGVGIRTGFQTETPLELFFPDKNGVVDIFIQELERVELHLEAGGDWCPVSSLPVGASFDTEKGIFYWLPGPGFLGTYEFEFAQMGYNNQMGGLHIRVTIGPQSEK